MRWILLDVALSTAALVLLALVLLSVWRKVKALGREVTRAGDTLGAVTAALDGLQGPGERPDIIPTPAGHQSTAQAPFSGVRSPESAGTTRRV